MARGIKVDARKLEEIQATLAKASGQRVKVGVLQSGAAGDQVEGAELTMAELAAIHEFGAPNANIPERSFIRRTFREAEAALKAFMAKQAKRIAAGKLEPEDALERIGQWGAAAVRARIRAQIPPELKQATIDRKGSSTPLIDTGALAASVTYEVADGQESGE